MKETSASPPVSIDHQLELRRVFGRFPSGVVALAAAIDDNPVGMAASSFTSVSLDPPLVAVCIARNSTTWPVLRRANEVGISVLAADHFREGRQLASKDGDRFQGIPWTCIGEYAIWIDGAAATITSRVVEEIPAGDHLVVLLSVEAVEARLDVEPLVFHGSTFRLLQSMTR